MSTTDTVAALTTIIARCPGLLRQATDALRASRGGSPIAARRVARVAAAALDGYGDVFDPPERAALAALAAVPDPEPGARTTNLLVRVSPAEKTAIEARAAAAGQTVSAHIRARLGIDRAGGEATTAGRDPDAALTRARRPPRAHRS